MKKIALIFITLLSLKCFAQDPPCVWQDGNYRYYVRLIIDNIPQSDFDKTDFITHIETNSNPSNSDLTFLNNSIIGVSPSFPSSMNENLQKTVTVTSDYDSMDSFLISFSESLDLVELFCESELGIETFELKSSVLIFPNPISKNSKIFIDERINFKRLNIIDITGKQIISDEINNEKTILFSKYSLANGIYFLKFSNEDLSITRKIIVNQS